MPVRAAQLPALRRRVRAAKLHSAEITVPDLRGGFSHLIAALAAEGTSKVHGIGLIDRGYERFGEKLAALGAMVERG